MQKSSHGHGEKSSTQSDEGPDQGDGTIHQADICGQDSVKTKLQQWTMGPTRRVLFSEKLVEILAKASSTVWTFVVVLGSLRTEWAGKNSFKWLLDIRERNFLWMASFELYDYLEFLELALSM